MLDWEENLFLGLKAAYRRWVVLPRQRAHEEVAAYLRDRRSSLLILAQMIAGRPLAIFESEEPVLCREDRVFLPKEFGVARSREANEAFYEVKTVVAGLALRDDWHRNGVSLMGKLQGYAAEFPALAEKLAAVTEALPPGVELGALLGALPEPAAVSESGARWDPLIPRTDRDSQRIATEIEGKGSADVTVLPAREDDGDGAEVPMHTFEKVETVEEYNGLSRKSDGDDELAEHAEGLSEVTMTHVLRSAERPRSLYRCDVILDGLAVEVNDEAPAGGIPYPEWNHRAGKYRDAWCHVQEGVVESTDDEWVSGVEVRHRRLIREMRRQFAALTTDWVRLRRQPLGDEFDLDAVIDAEVQRRTGHTPSESIYLDRRRDVKDVAALILMDESYSTDAWLEDRRVLDIIRESVFCVGEVLETDVASFGVATFSSNTRRSCGFQLVKGFQEPWRSVRGRLGALEPRGYTRIGPALRHAQEMLARQTASRRIVILITDGRPCDYDRYEGTYGIKDVKKAIEVGRQVGIHTHAFAVEKQAAEFFPQMFSRHDYDILPHPDRLARTMCRLFARFLAKDGGGVG
ncbi:MAG: VWA domain-containing protein [Verrucomicrobiales bacterium]|nr:VWA domain-containing protein [Verrucomicrobiales bacterium]